MDTEVERLVSQYVDRWEKEADKKVILQDLHLDPCGEMQALWFISKKEKLLTGIIKYVENNTKTPPARPGGLVAIAPQPTLPHGAHI